MHKVLFVTSEAQPLAKTGGLGDVCGSLPPALQSIGVDVRLLLPAYPSAKRAMKSLRRITDVRIPFVDASATLLEGVMPETRVTTWLVDFPPAYDRAGNPYLDAHGQPWPDNAQRFALLSMVAVALARGETGVNWHPDIVHCHDWQTGLVPALLAQHDRRPGTLFTIHNLAYQGLFPPDMLQRLALPPHLWAIDGLEFYGQLSFMKGGLAFADRLTTVSPTYAKEIQTPELGYGLDGLLRHRAHDLVGILNGIDTAAWDPARDPHLRQRYSARSFARKKTNKAALQELLQLAVEPDTPLIGMVGRMVEQKGFDLALAAWPALAPHGAQLALLGSGEGAMEAAWRDVQQHYPGRLAVRIGYNEALAHQIEAGADIFLMPSRFEPCGLNQMYSLRYGTVPVVRRVGGLADTVIDATDENLANGIATGVVFDGADARAVIDAMRHALALYRNPRRWRELAFNGMRQDFSWRKSAGEYAALYQRIVPLAVPTSVSA